MFYTFDSNKRCVCKSSVYTEYPKEFISIESNIDYPFDQITLENGSIIDHGHSLDTSIKSSLSTSKDTIDILNAISGLNDIVQKQQAIIEALQKAD